MRLEVGKFYKTRDGRKAEVVYINEDLATMEQILVIIDGDNFTRSYNTSGETLSTVCDCLIEEWKEPVRVKGWFNVYGDKLPHLGHVAFSSKENCLVIKSPHIIGQIYIDQEVEK